MFMIVGGWLLIGSAFADNLSTKESVNNKQNALWATHSDFGDSPVKGPVPLVHRDDGFGQFYREPPLSRETLEKDYIDFLRGTNVKVKEWGLGPGETYTFDTKAGEIFLEQGLTEEQLKMMRRGDRWVNQNVKLLIAAGNCPLKVAVERGHAVGLEVWGRLEMNHGYAPVRDDNWMWFGFSGTFIKDNPQYRVPGRSTLDYKHQAVRDFRLAVLREAAEKGVDGISMDFVVYPPHLSDPAADKDHITQFMRDMRAMADETGQRQGRRIKLITRVPYDHFAAMWSVPERMGPGDPFQRVPQGLDWRTWVKEGLVDILMPSSVRTAFDVPLKSFVDATRGTRTQVYGCIRNTLGTVNTDQEPGEEEKGIRRYDRPKTEAIYNAQAMLLLRSGVDGIQLAMSENCWQPFFNDLGNFNALRFKDKDYLADASNPLTLARQLPVQFPLSPEVTNAVEKQVVLRVADDVADALAAGYEVNAAMVLFCRSLGDDEKLTIYVNDNGPFEYADKAYEPVSVPVQRQAEGGDMKLYEQPDWWKRGMRRFSVPAGWWRLGNNLVTLRYQGRPPENTTPFRVLDLNLKLSYRRHTQSSGLASDDKRVKEMSALYQGAHVDTAEGLEAYTGKVAADRIVGEARRDVYLLNYEQLGVNYGENVDFQLRRQQVILCPQTVAYLYGDFTSAKVRYKRGMRPELDNVVAQVSAGCVTDREKALALMRFCRDLYKKKTDIRMADYVYGGTEEQLIAKPDILCETLSRLMVALCEVAGIPGRIVMHNAGGHITTEIFIENGWGYIDPRAGIYYLKRDGAFASVWDLVLDPSIMRTQRSDVKADVSDQWNWEFRTWKCENMFFNLEEINGFQNYSLADYEKYKYEQRSDNEATAAGLYVINKSYVAKANKVLGLSDDWSRTIWSGRRLKKTPIAYRHDGFSMYYRDFLITREYLESRYVDSFKDTNAEILVWGLGPGSVFCFETKAGQIFGEGLTEAELGMLRKEDRWVHKNVMNLIKEGPGGPLGIAVQRAREHGLKLYARLSMQHEYGPADTNNWMWVGLTGKLNKQHPEYRIGNSVRLDFKHQEVRNFKAAILREAVEAGADGVEMDFSVYPPFFAKPDVAIMNQFMREVRETLDGIAARQGRRVNIMARVPFIKSMSYGVDWQTWMREKLVDIITPTHLRPADHFDIRIEEFVELAKQTGTLVYPTIWQALGFVNTDQEPEDEKTGRKRYTKPKTPGMFYAQALLFQRAGADGLQLGFSEDQWVSSPWMNELADPEKVLFADKHYTVDPIQLNPGTFGLSDGKAGGRSVKLRIGDDIAAARKAGYKVTTSVLVYMRHLRKGEKVEILVNSRGSALIEGSVKGKRKDEGGEPVDYRTQEHSSFMFKPGWWKHGEHSVVVNEDYWRLGDNEIDIKYSSAEKVSDPPSIIWIDVLVDYEKKDN